MSKEIKIFSITFALLFLLDQIIKIIIVKVAGISMQDPLFLDSFTTIASTNFIDITLVFNKGVAFSFLDGLGVYLKYIQIAFILAFLAILIKQGNFFKSYYLEFALIFSGGISNILDRFTYGGVVDYIYWHYLFNFAIFNFADTIINIGILLLLVNSFIFKKDSKDSKDSKLA